MKKNTGTNIGHYFKQLTCTLFVVLGLLGIFAPASQAATGAFTFSAATSAVSEGAGNVNITINRVGGSTGAASVSWRTNALTSTFDQDFTSFSWTTISFAAGETKKILPIKIIDDTLIEPNETFKVSLAYPSTGTTLGNITSAVVTILDNDSDTTAPTVSLSSPATGTSFTNAQTVTIAAAAADNIGVSKVELYDGATLVATDTTSPYSFAWAITAANNGSHTLTAKAYDAAGNSKVSAAVAVTVNIAPGAFTFSAAAYSVDEGAGNVNITINRVGGSTGAATVQWRTNAITATFDQDFSSFSWTTLSFAAGETQKILPIKIIDDPLIEVNETFKVSLSSPTNGTTLGSITSAVVTILDNDSDITAPTVALTSPATSTTFTNAQTVTIAVAASDNTGVSKVELYDGAILKATDTTSPYNFAWAITDANNGSHSLTAKAYDAAGNSKVSAAVAVTVNIANTVPVASSVFYGYDKSAGINDDPNAAPYGGVTRYVDPVKGVNSGNGSLSSPWKDLQYALTHAAAGDSIYLRGGVHNYGITINGNVASTQLKPVEVRSYPGEWAIIDGTNIANGNLIRLFNESWIIFRNFEVRYSDKSKVSNGIYAENLTDCEFHNIYMHNNNGAGFSAKELYRVKFYNCSAINNVDSQTSGDSADGFSVTSGASNAFYRCVATGNSDDGYDFWAASKHYLEDCIAAMNGSGTGGDGNGFKLGKPDPAPYAGLRGGYHTLVRCISLKNRFRGYSENATTNGSTFTGCIAYSSGQNWELPSAAHKITNGISFDGNGDKIGSSTTVTASKGQGFGGTVYVADYESVSITNMNNQTAGQRFFYAVRNLF